MKSSLKEWLEENSISWSLNWHHLRRMVQQARGVAKDCSGKRYWRYVREYSPGHFRLSLHTWPGLTCSSGESAGWIAVGIEKGKTTWMIYDVRVDRPRYQQRGIGTALVQAAIVLARARGGTHLWGWIMHDDAQTHPFLPRWYAQLGFTVETMTEGDALARIRMDLQPASLKTT